MAQLFGDEKYTASILEFLATTEVGMGGRQRTDITVGNFDGPEKRMVQQENPIVVSAKKTRIKTRKTKSTASGPAYHPDALALQPASDSFLPGSLWIIHIFSSQL
jgi:hypothetical protein